MSLTAVLLIAAALNTVLWFFFPNAIQWVCAAQTAPRIRIAVERALPATGLFGFLFLASLTFTPKFEVFLGLFWLACFGMTAGLLLRHWFDSYSDAGRPPENDLDELVAAITPENRHDEIPTGPAVGREI